MDFDVSRLKGAHKVTEGKERVWIRGRWSIEIPADYTYAIDPETDESSGGGACLLHVRKSEDCGPAASCLPDVDVLVYAAPGKLECNTADLLNEDTIKAVRSNPIAVTKSFQIRKSSEDIIVLSFVDEETADMTRYSFLVAVRGCNVLYSGVINCHSGTAEERRDTIPRWLDSLSAPSEE